MEKPLIIENFERASLADIMRCYGSTIRCNPRAWLAGLKFNETELSAYPELIGQVRTNNHINNHHRSF